ncbi:hypothetical protein D9M68_994090 [compost metagenome]
MQTFLAGVQSGRRPNVRDSLVTKFDQMLGRVLQCPSVIEAEPLLSKRRVPADELHMRRCLQQAR